MYNISGSIKKKIGFDRFIPIRKYTKYDQINLESSTDQNSDLEIKSESYFINRAKKRLMENNYKYLLREALGLENDRILHFSSPKDPNISDPIHLELWPVKARKQPLIGPPQLILDLPNFDSNIRHHVTDWSSNGYIATIYDNEVCMWNPCTDIRFSTETSRRIQHCIKWNPRGDQIAVAFNSNKFAIIGAFTNKILCENFCCESGCNILCIEWTCNNYLITGCSQGKLVMRDTKNLDILKSTAKAHSSDVICIISSCRKNYFISSGLDKYIRLWKLPSFEGVMEIQCSFPTRAIAWHPWKESLVAIAFNANGASLTVWDINKQKQLDYRKNYRNQNWIFCLKFNPISGELVVSHYLTEENSNRANSVIEVLSNLDNIVEELYIHRGRVLYLLWGNEGRSLGTVSDDEHLCIWNFFDMKKQEEKNLEQSKRGLPQEMNNNHEFLLR